MKNSFLGGFISHEWPDVCGVSAALWGNVPPFGHLTNTILGQLAEMFVWLQVTADHSTGLNMLSRIFYGLDGASGSLI